MTLLRRERLVSFMHSNINHKLIMVSAGAGYGKTSLLVDYAHDADLPVCWYSLDSADNQVSTFIQYLVASIRRRFPGFGQKVLSALADFSGPAEDIEPFVRLLLDEIQQSVDDYFVLILDDFHEVLESEPVNALVDGLLRYLPEHCHMIIASRAIPRRLTLTRLAAREEIVGLGVRQLKFTRDEISQVLALRGMTEMTDEQLDALALRSEGWITAILLAAQTRWTDTIRSILELSGTLDNVFGYLAREVLTAQPQHVQSFLLGSSVLQEMSPPLCDALLQIDDSAQILRSLSEQGLFTSEISNASGWYQYHQLFREFLLTRLEEEMPALYRDLCLREARLMANQGHWAWAIDGYIAAGAFEDAAGAIEIIAQDYFDAGQGAAIKEWIDSLPPHVLDEHPRLMLFRARVSTELGEYAEAEQMLEPAYRLYVERGSEIGAARVLIQWAIVQRLQERYQDAVDSCHTVLRTASEGDDPSSHIKAYQNLGICYQILGDAARGQQEMRRALELAQAYGDTLNAAFIAHDLGNSLYIEGAVEEARRYLHQALLHWRKVGNPGDLAMTLQGLGVIHHHQGEYAEAQNRYEESLERARNIQDRRLEAYALLNMGDLHRDQGHLDQALSLYQEAFDVASSVGQSGLMIYILAAQGDVHRLQRDVALSRQTLTEALDQSERQGLEEPIGLCHLAFGALALQESDLTSARKHLETAQSLLERVGMERDIGRVHLQMALLALCQGDREAIRAHLSRIGEIAAELGTEQFIIAEGAGAIPLLESISEFRIAGLDATRIRAQIEGLFPSVVVEPQLRVVRPNAELELLGLDGGQVIYQGRVVREFESSVARTMAFLLAEHPAGLPKERIADLLWQDVSQARAESLFHSTMYRLRKALDKRVIILEGGVYRLNPRIVHRYDVQDFESLIRLGQGSDPAAHLARMNAIDLYRTDYLEFCDSPWCYDIRQALQHDMIQILTREAEYLCSRSQIQQAETLYLRVLALDEFDERAHRGVMWCRAKLGDPSGAARQYRECTRIIADEMGLSPHPDTTTLYTLIHGGQLPASPR
ncbi:MAG: tetratricopeptide repeat protein [Chloroflexi bacterium]|nr:tetratricopeptide repeat protein [Chloroflexota bacterium]